MPSVLTEMAPIRTAAKTAMASATGSTAHQGQCRLMGAVLSPKIAHM